MYISDSDEYEEQRKPRSKQKKCGRKRKSTCKNSDSEEINSIIDNSYSSHLNLCLNPKIVCFNFKSKCKLESAHPLGPKIIKKKVKDFQHYLKLK